MQTLVRIHHLKAALVLSSAVASGLAVGATTPRDSDGVPTVDLHGRIVETQPAAVVQGVKLDAQRQRRITVDDKEMPLLEFITTFCQGKRMNATCTRALTIRRIDNVSGPVEQLPKGL